MEYVLQTCALKKHYGSFKALDGLNMSVPKGAIYGFVGKNGAGKTTLIRLICGLQEPTAGKYSLCGVSSRDREITRVRQRIGAVVETPSIYSGMTAEENMKQQYRILGIPSFDTIPEMLELVGLGDAGRKKVRNFSLGMRQRLGIAIALAGSPDFLILDEPVNGLDPQGIVEIREIILRLNREHEITFLISSHILDELSRMATHFGFIDRGHMVKELSASELNDACQKRVRLEVSDVKALVRVLDEKKLDYSVCSNTKVDIFGTISVTELALRLAGENCSILSITEQEESLENFYINLIGGGEHD